MTSTIITYDETDSGQTTALAALTTAGATDDGYGIATPNGFSSAGIWDGNGYNPSGIFDGSIYYSTGIWDGSAYYDTGYFDGASTTPTTDWILVSGLTFPAPSNVASWEIGYGPTGTEYSGQLDMMHGYIAYHDEGIYYNKSPYGPESSYASAGLFVSNLGGLRTQGIWEASGGCHDNGILDMLGSWSPNGILGNDWVLHDYGVLEYNEGNSTWHDYGILSPDHVFLGTSVASESSHTFA